MTRESETQPLEAEALKDAFVRFSEASSRLESKYQLLLEESQTLREVLRQKEEEIKRQERLAMLGETAAALAHEVRNPLGAIRLFVSLLRRDLSEKPKSIEIIDQIDGSISALDNVVSNILQFSRERKLVFAPVNIHSIIQEQLLRFPRSATNTATFELNLLANPFLNGNESSLRQVFYNLIFNALQATNHKGHIIISSEDAGDQLRATLRDNGPGIPEEILNRLFEPFVTTKNEGTGLGLAIVKKIVEQHGGSIEVVNDHGAVFRITFPRGGGI